MIEKPQATQDATRWFRFCCCGTFVILLIGFLKYAKPVLLPVVLALLLMLIFAPIVGVMQKRLHIPRFVSAFLVVILLTVGVTLGGYYLTGPIGKYVSQLESEEAQSQLSEVFQPMQEIHGEIKEVVNKIEKISKQKVEIPQEEDEEGKTEIEITTGERKTEIETNALEASEKKVEKPKQEKPDEEKPEKDSPEPEPVTVAIDQDPVGAIYTWVQEFGLYLLSTLFLLLFLLSYGDQMAQRLGEARGTPKLLEEIQRDVSVYLFTITWINMGLGVAIGFSLSLLGVKDAYLWGLMAFFLNFIPYAGAVIGAFIVTIITALATQSLPDALIAGAVYMGLSSLEGNVITPSVIGRRFAINPVIVFLWVLAWSALWGLPGMLIGLPLLMAFRIVCARVPTFAGIERAITMKSS